jgi:type IV pilus assembly protein PilM
MAVNSGIWGIDVGQCALKALRLEMIDGVVTATAFDYVEHPKILSQPDANPDDLTREALEKFLSRNATKGDAVAMSVPGQSGLARFVKLPPVEEKKIIDIVKFEAKQQIPFPLEEVVWDYQKVSEGTVTDGFAMDTEIGLFAMKRDMINRYISHFQAAKMEVHYVQMAPLALANFVTYELLKRGGPDGEAAAPTIGKKKCAVALDIGTDGSNLIITDGARIIWQRPIPVGGNHFTRALTKELKLTFAKAEHLKRNAAKSPELANILKALRPVLQEFVGEVQRSLGYFTNTHRDAQVDYMVGLGSAFKLPGLQKFLADKLSLDVRRLSKFERVAGEAVTDAPVFTENLLSYPVAYGLALQGLGVARINTNLLPSEITIERKIRAKKPYAVAAAASLLLGTTALAFGYSIPLKDVADDRIKTALDSSEGVVKQAQSLDSDIAKKKEEIEKTSVDVQSIIAGQMERENWLKINQFVYDSVPIPGPAGNMLGGLEQFWGLNKGPDALRKYHERMAKGIDPIASIGDDDLREFLPMIDIESVYARYTDNVKAAYEAIEVQRRRTIGSMRNFPGSDLYPDDWWEKKDGVKWPPPESQEYRETKKPEGAGWIVEIRGSTYYQPTPQSNPSDFIHRTLVANLIERGHIRPELQLTDDQKKLLEKDPIRGKVSHVFVYEIKKDDNPSPMQLRFFGNNIVDGFIAAAAAAGAASASGDSSSSSMPGMTPPAGGGGGYPPGAMSGGMPGGPGGMPGSGGGFGTGWVPLTSAGGANTGGMGGPSSGMGSGKPMMGMGMPGMPGGSPGMPGGSPSMPGMPGLPGGLPGGFPGGPGSPGLPGGSGDGIGTSSTPGNSAVVVKPRYEFVIMMVWREPTPSDKLRPSKILEAPVATGSFGGGMGGPSMAPPSAPPAVGGGGLGGSRGLD